MKKILALLPITALTLIVSTTGAAPIPLPTAIAPITIKLTAYVQNDVDELSNKTNQNSSGISVTTKTKLTTSKFTLTESDFLILLANSFNTNFPSGSQISTVSGSIFVSDQTGTNAILNVSTVMYFNPGQVIWTGTETLVTTVSGSGTEYSDTSSYSGIGVSTLNYDDSGMTPVNGKHTVMKVPGSYNSKSSFKKDTYKNSFTFTGQGDGIIQEVFTILTGTIKGTGPGPIINN